MKPFKKYIHRSGGNHPKAKLLAIGGVLFCLGVITSISTTYAWFTINVLGSIDHLQLNIRSENNYDLQLWLQPKYGDAYHNEGGYTLSEMGYDADTKLHDVSGMFSNVVDENDQVIYSEDTVPQFRKSYGSFPSRPHESFLAEKGYLQTEFILKSNMDCYVFLSKDSKFTPDYEGNMKTADNDLVKADELNKVTKSVRMSFFTEEGYFLLREDDSYDTPYGGPLDMNGDGFYDTIIGEDGVEREVLYGQYDENVEVAYWTDPSESELPLEDGNTTFTAHHKKGVQHVNMATGAALTIKKENSATIDSLQYDEERFLEDYDNPIVVLDNPDENGIRSKRLVFSLYCEGWDPYMTDEIANASFKIDLGFVALVRDDINR